VGSVGHGLVGGKGCLHALNFRLQFRVFDLHFLQRRGLGVATEMLVAVDNARQPAAAPQ
jgi:hypothetical protein